MLFTYMVPVFFLQTAQKRSNIFKRPVPVSPTNMLFEPKHLRKCSGRVPCRKHERQGRLPVVPNSRAVRQHLPQLDPANWLRANTPVLAAIRNQGFNGIVHSSPLTAECSIDSSLR